MSGEQGVTYSLSRLKRAGFVGGGKYLQLVTDHDPKQALAAFAAAIEVANDIMRLREIDEIFGMIVDPVQVPGGPMARVEECEPAKALSMLIDLVAVELTDRGITGTLQPKGVYRDDLFGWEAFPTLGVLLFPLMDIEALYAHHGHGARRSPPGTVGIPWFVEESRQHRFLDALCDWVFDTPNQADDVDDWAQATVVASLGATPIELDPDGARAALHACLPDDPFLGIRRIAGPRALRSLTIDYNHGVLVQSYGPDLPRSHHLGLLLDLARTTADDVAYAIVREMHTANIQPMFAAKFPPQMPIGKRVGDWQVKHLEPEYTYDAGIAQILTDRHLAHIGDLPAERWHTEHLGPDRHLVAHRQPERWYNHATYLPKDPAAWGDFVDQPLIDQARADFRHGLLTDQILARHPLPGLP